jgi:predicted DNA-binding transcriptional regulator AlpA
MSLDNEERLVGYDVAIAMAGVSRAEIQRRIKDKRFPIPIRDGGFRNSRTLFSLLALRRYVQLKLAGQDWTPPE